MTIENWPGRGYYRGNKQAAIADAMRLGGAVVISSKPTPSEAVIAPPPKLLDPPFIAATEPGDPKSMGYTGNQCTGCNSMRMVVSGHCEVCLDCGNSSGCS